MRSDEPDPWLDRQVGQYSVVARAGAGAMGRVYRAFDLALGRWVALKVLPPAWRHDQGARRRLLCEAQILSALVHPRICSLYNVEVAEDGQPFIVMAWYDGRTLREVLQDGPCGLELALEFAAQVAEGLSHAHIRGFIHGDIKPGNLIATEDGIRILDFGLARWVCEPLDAAGPWTRGTVAYMSPEQARGETVDARSDLWSLGVLLYEALTGRRPFAGSYPEELAYTIGHGGQLPMVGPHGEIPAAVRDLLRTALAADPASRFQHARDMACAIRAAAAQLPAQAPAGRTIAHYQIGTRLGRGGTGEVYEAEDTHQRRVVALKFLDEEIQDDPDAVRRLRREGHILAALAHRNICTVYETLSRNGRTCLVMERLHGTTLSRRLLRGPLDTAELLTIGIQVARALAAAHGAGIVHRDIKPGNIFVDEEGQVKLLDFGLARHFRIPASGDPADGSTEPGRPYGTANYMAPERILQTAVGPASDLFSLGVVIFEMATERLPFAGPSPAETVMNVLDADPMPLGRLSPDRPPSLERLVNRLLAKRPESRFPSAESVADALHAISRESSSLDRPVTRTTATDYTLRAVHEGGLSA